MIIIGVDFHPEFQQIASVDTDTGEFQQKRLTHREEAEKIYRALACAGQKVRVAMEASGHARWFERLLAELQIELLIGDAAEIRTKRVRKQKTDRQDAQLILMPSDVAHAAAEPEGATPPASAANPPHMPSKVAVPKPSRMIKPSAPRTADSQYFAEHRVQRAQKVEIESNADRYNPSARLQTPARGVGQRTAENAPGVEATAPIPSGEAENLSSALSAVLSAPLDLPQRTVTISQGVSEGRLQHRVLPEYPAQARSLRLEGPVVLEAMVMEDGSVHDIKLVSGHPTLARAALDAVRQWRYQPYRLNGKPVAMRTEIRVTFKLP